MCPLLGLKRQAWLPRSPEGPLRPSWALLLTWHSFPCVLPPYLSQATRSEPLLCSGVKGTKIAACLPSESSGLVVPGKGRFSFPWNLACLLLGNSLLSSPTGEQGSSHSDGLYQSSHAAPH